MTQHFRLSETDCLQIAEVQHRLIRSDRWGSIWARLDQDDIRLAFTGTELLQCLAAPDTRLLRGHFSHGAALRRLRCDLKYLATCEPHKRRHALWQETWAKYLRSQRSRRRAAP